MKKIAALVLTLALVAGSFAHPVEIGAKVLKENAFSIHVKEAKKLSIQNVKKKVVWKIISGKDKIRITTSGKVSVIVRGKKKGTSKLQAKAGSQKVTYKITVKAAKKNAVSKSSENTAVKYQKEVLQLVNQERSKRGLKKLKLHTKLSKAAKIRAKELLKEFSHTRPNGDDCFSVFDEIGLSYRACGENIAAGQGTPKSVVNAWMASSGHRANILSEEYTYMGLGFCRTSGDYRYYWAQMFLS